MLICCPLIFLVSFAVTEERKGSLIMFKRLILVAVLALYLMFLSTEIIDFSEAKGLKDSAVAAWSFDGN